MREKCSSIRIMVAGGGTGGHVFPAIAIANAFLSRHPEGEVLFVGAQGRMEMTRVPEAGYRIVGLPIVGMPRHWSLIGMVRFLWNWWCSNRAARRLIKEFSPDVVVGVGGYASVPVMQMAQRLGVDTVIQEQNGYAGVANRLLARCARRICVAYEGMERFFPASSIELTGNPVRQMICPPFPDVSEARRELGLPEGGQVILVVGGSLGARALNEAVVSGLGWLRAHPSVCVLLQTGSQSYGETFRATSGYTAGNLRVCDFISRMDYAYAAADLIVSRAGAIAISELCVVGKPVVLVPSPHVAEDHQTKNARALVALGAALMLPDAEVAEQLLPLAFDLLEDAERCKCLGENIGKLARPNAAERIAEIVINLARGEG